MSAPLKTRDSAVASTPTARAVVKGGGMPAASPATDPGVATATAQRPDVFNPPVGPNPPTATPDVGGA